MKKFIAILMSMMIILAYTPLTADAATVGTSSNPKTVSTASALNTAISGAKNCTRYYIKLTGDISGKTINVPKNKVITINLNGHKISYSSTAISCGGDLTLKNGTVTSTGGKAIDAYTTSEHTGTLKVSDCTVSGKSNAILAGGKTSPFIKLQITDSKLSSSTAGALVAYHGDVSITDSTFKVVTDEKSGIYAYGLDLKADGAKITATNGAYGINLAGGSSAELSGGKITYSGGGNAIKVQSKGKCITTASASTTTSKAVFNVDGGTVSVNGGTIDSSTIGALNSNDRSRIRISGGTFNFKPASKYIVGGYIPYESDGKWKIKINEGTLKVGDAVALQEAIDTSGSTVHIVLTDNIKTTSDNYTISIPEGKKVYLDLDGHYLKAPSGDYSAIFLDGTLDLKDTAGGGYVVQIAAYDKSNLILRSGTIKGAVIKDGSYEYGQSALRAYGSVSIKGGTVTADKSTAIDVFTEKTVKISGGKVTSSSSQDAAIYVNAGKLEVSGGTVTGAYRGIWTSGSEASLLVTGGTIYSVYKDYGSTRTLKGGTYTKKPSSGIADGYEIYATDGKYKVVKQHQWDSVITKATLTKNGKIEKTCKACGEKDTVTISHPEKMSLSYTKCTYSGKEKKPSVTVTNANGKTIDSAYYTVEYADNKYVGKATVTVKFKTRYTGSMSKTFNINPKGTSITGMTGGDGYVNVKWTKVETQTTGYQIRYSTSSSMSSYKTVTVSDNSLGSKKITGLTSMKKYYAKVRTYRTVDGTKYYSGWSDVKSASTVCPPDKVSLSYTKCTYGGEYMKPSVTVKDKNGKKIESKYYTVSYSNNKNVGKAKVTVKFKSPYSGSKSATFTISPKKTSIYKLTPGEKCMTVNWYKRSTQTTGYQLRYSTGSSMSSYTSVTISDNQKNSKKITDLKSNKKYYFKVRTYKTVDGTKYYSGWSEVESATTK